jgi:hypothetical protein
MSDLTRPDLGETEPDYWSGGTADGRWRYEARRA